MPMFVPSGIILPDPDVAKRGGELSGKLQDCSGSARVC